MSIEPRTSRVVMYHELGGPEVLTLESVTVAAPQEGEVRVRFVAGGLNPVDAKIRTGRSRIQLPLPVSVGREFSGVIESVGHGVTAVSVGDTVFGSIPHGAFADWVLAPASVIARVPKGVPLEVAAGLALAGQTAWDALDSQDLHSGDVIVVSAAAGGVGGILSQVAVARGIRVIGTASEATFSLKSSTSAGS